MDLRGDDMDVVLVLIPGRRISVPVSRRERMAALGIGAIGGGLLGGLHRAVVGVVDEEVLAELDLTLTGLKAAGRVMAPAGLIGPLTAHPVVVLSDPMRSER